jgi:CheY-like chemotaxis protein
LLRKEQLFAGNIGRPLFAKAWQNPADTFIFERRKLTFNDSAKSPIPSSDSPKTILLIEDDLIILDLFRISLRRKGHHVLTATDVSEAEEIWALARTKIDVVLSDNRLGYDLGVELLQRFQKEEPNVHFVLCSGEPLATANPGMQFLAKPFSVDVVLNGC